MKNVTLTSLIKMASPTHLVQLLEKTYPHLNEAIERKKETLLSTLTPRKKIAIIKQLCTTREYYDFIKQLSDLCHILETDLNAPILYKLLEKKQVDYPKDYTFQDLTIWLYLHHPLLWDDLLHRSFMRTPKCQAHACVIIPGCRSCWDYENPKRIETFERLVPTIFEGADAGEVAELILDDTSNGIYRAILLLSPKPRNVFTYERDANTSFSVQPDKVARKMVLIYNEKLEMLWIVGGIADRKTRIALAARWAETFLGGTCEKEALPPTYDLEFFKTSPMVFNDPHPCFKELFISSITLCRKGYSDYKITVSASKLIRLPREIIDLHAAVYHHQIDILHVDMTIVMKTPLHGIERFNIALAPHSISLGVAENCDDIRAMVEDVLGGFNVSTHKL